MADDKKNIPDAVKWAIFPEQGKVEPGKVAPSVQDQPAPVKTEQSVVESKFNVVLLPVGACLFRAAAAVPFPKVLTGAT